MGTFGAWPDNYYCIDNNLRVIGKSEYYLDSEKEATIIEDCITLLETLLYKLA